DAGSRPRAPISGRDPRVGSIRLGTGSRHQPGDGFARDGRWPSPSWHSVATGARAARAGAHGGAEDPCRRRRGSLIAWRLLSWKSQFHLKGRCRGPGAQSGRGYLSGWRPGEIARYDGGDILTIVGRSPGRPRGSEQLVGPASEQDRLAGAHDGCDGIAHLRGERVVEGPRWVIDHAIQRDELVYSDGSHVISLIRSGPALCGQAAAPSPAPQVFRRAPLRLPVRYDS